MRSRFAVEVGVVVGAVCALFALSGCGDSGGSGASGGGGGDVGGSGGTAGTGGSDTGGGASIQFCKEQHEGTVDGDSVILCDATFDDAPFVHLPEEARLDSGNFEGYFALTAEGFTNGTDTYVFPGGLDAAADEGIRHAFALYRVEHDEAGTVVSYAPAVLIDERNILRFFENLKLQGFVSRKTGDNYELEPTLPIFATFGTAEVADDSVAGMTRYRVPITVDNLSGGIEGEDGACLAPIESAAAENPFAAFSPDLAFSRVPSMHAPFDDEAVIAYSESGSTVMSPSFYLDVADLIVAGAPVFEAYEAYGHGTPGYIPSLFLHVASSGGASCSP